MAWSRSVGGRQRRPGRPLKAGRRGWSRKAEKAKQVKKDERRRGGPRKIRTPKGGEKGQRRRIGQGRRGRPGNVKKANESESTGDDQVIRAGLAVRRRLSGSFVFVARVFARYCVRLWVVLLADHVIGGSIRLVGLYSCLKLWCRGYKAFVSLIAVLQASLLLWLVVVGVCRVLPAYVPFGKVLSAPGRTWCCMSA